MISPDKRLLQVRIRSALFVMIPCLLIACLFVPLVIRNVHAIHDLVLLSGGSANNTELKVRKKLLEQENRKLAQELKLLSEQPPQSRRYELAMEQLNRMAESAGLSFSNAKVGEESDTGGVVGLPILLTGNARFVSVARFINLLERDGVRVNIQKVDLTSDGAVGERVNLEMRVVFYYAGNKS